MRDPGRREERSDYRGAVLLVLLLALTVAAFGATRVLRSQDDIVNTVRLTDSITRGEQARIRFRLTDPEGRADVLIVDSEGSQVRALALGRALEAGTHAFRWDGRGDEGEPVPAGSYRLRVILVEQGRDIEPPGAVEVGTRR